MAPGVKVTLIVQDAPPFSDVPHVFVCVKSLASVPLNVRVPIEIAAVLAFVTVTV